jgi:hypothetical protein
MGDSRLFSLVLCHAHSAQIVESSRRPALDAFGKRFKEESLSPDKPEMFGQLFIDARRGRISPVSAMRKGNEFQKFPTNQTRLSKANVEICIFCVNLPQKFSPMLLSILLRSAENEGQSSVLSFP